MILVTGAGGFVGSHVMAHLSRTHDEQSVRGLLRSSARRPSRGFAPFVGDVRDRESLVPAMRGVDTVVHLATKTLDRDGEGFDETNVLGTRHVVETAIEAGVQRIIYLSSVGVYGHRRLTRADESTKTAPDTPLSHSRAKAEETLLQAHRQGRLQTTILRPRFIYGEGDRHFLARLLPAFSRYPFLVGGGRAELSMVWAGDIAASISKLIEDHSWPEEDSPIYHSTDGQSRTFKELATLLCHHFGIRRPRLWMPYRILHTSLKLYESIRGIDPENSRSSFTSMRIRLIGLDSSFSNQKWTRRFPEFSWHTLEELLPRLEEHYRGFLENRKMAGG